MVKQTRTTGTREMSQLLQEEYLSRLENNPRYSLRAFARFLKIDSSALSQILRGQRPVGKKLLRRFAQKLSLTPEVMYALDKHATQPATDALHVAQIDVDTLRVIGDWYHFALMELPKISLFRADRDWAARKLGITRIEVDSALERLERLKMIRLLSNGGWVRVADSTTHTQMKAVPSTRQKLQRQILQKALVAVDNLPLGMRDNSSLICSGSSKLLPEIARRTDAFRQEIHQLMMQSREEPDCVFHFGVFLYPVTELNIQIEKGIPSEANS